MENKSLQRITWWILGTVIVLQFVMPFVYPLVGHDGPVHLNWLDQFCRLFRDGNLYPRWMPDSFWGFGSPAFYFYPPLTYWSAGLISFIFPNSSVAVYQVLGLFATIASVLTCYWYLRQMTANKRSVLLGAIIYGVLPYRLLDLYLRNALGEHLAFIFLPLVFLGIEVILKQGKVERTQVVTSIVISAIGWSGIFLSNIPSGVIVLYTLPFYCLIRIRKNYNRRTFLVFPFIGFVLGVMIAAIYFLPILRYDASIKLSHLWDRWQVEGNTGYAILDFMNGNYRYFYIALIVSLLSGLWILYKFYKNNTSDEYRNITTAFKTILIVAIAFQIPFLLMPLWQILPLFRLLQFTWRFDILIVLSSAVFISLYYQKQDEMFRTWFVGINSAITIIIALGYFYAMNGLHWSNKPPTGNVDAPEYVTESANNNIDLARNSFREHSMDPLIVQKKDSMNVHILSVIPGAVKFSKDSSQDEIPVIFHRMYFPAWHLRAANGKEIILTSDSLGRINTVLSAAAEEYRLALEESQEEKTGKIISIAGLSLLGIAILLTVFWRNPKAS